MSDLTKMTNEELVRAYGDTQFDCGSWDECKPDVPYNKLAAKLDVLRAELLRRLTPAVPPPAEQGDVRKAVESLFRSEDYRECRVCGHDAPHDVSCWNEPLDCWTFDFCSIAGCDCDEGRRVAGDLLATHTPQPAGVKPSTDTQEGRGVATEQADEPGYVTEHFAEIGRHAAARCNCCEMDGCYSQIRGLAKKGLQEMGAWADPPAAQSSPASDARAEAHKKCLDCGKARGGKCGACHCRTHEVPA